MPPILMEECCPSVQVTLNTWLKVKVGAVQRSQLRGRLETRQPILWHFSNGEVGSMAPPPGFWVGL